MIVADTSALIGAWHLHYGPDFAPGFWTFLETALESGAVAVIDVVRDEVADGSDGLSRWLKERDQLVRETPQEVQQLTGQLQARYRFGAGRDRADPFVVAYAKAFGFAVTTYEGLSPTGTVARARKDTDNIPTICRSESVECLKPGDAWARAGLSF